jgi:hypothetical protein
MERNLVRDQVVKLLMPISKENITNIVGDTKSHLKNDQIRAILEDPIYGLQK